MKLGPSQKRTSASSLRIACLCRSTSRARPPGCTKWRGASRARGPTDAWRWTYVPLKRARATLSRRTSKAWGSAWRRDIGDCVASMVCVCVVCVCDLVCLKSHHHFLSPQLRGNQSADQCQGARLLPAGGRLPVGMSSAQWLLAIFLDAALLRV
jgi:hypothetical protein